MVYSTEDWDDTICPTTALNEDSKLEVGCEKLQALVVEARQTLKKAREVAAEVSPKVAISYQSNSNLIAI